MGKIRILPDIVCHKIAAGEIIERPSAVVKELLENSLDAGSSHISVIFEKGGIKLIQVIDDGEGMDKEDALLALERHATSKISSIDDLRNIAFYGFRGEALSSISAVSRFELVTKTPEDDIGTVVMVEGGIVKYVGERAYKEGTRVTVRDLFFNLPARRKFLKSEYTERQHIVEQFRKIALANFNVSFKLYEGEKLIYNFPSTGEPTGRIFQVFGPNLGKNLVKCHGEGDYFKITCYLGSPDLYRSTASLIYLFVNKRPFRDSLLQRVVKESFSPFLPKDTYPVAIIFIEAEPKMVDVNVHPTKQEVRFDKVESLIGLIKGVIGSSFGKTERKDKKFYVVDQKSNFNQLGLSFQEKVQSKEVYQTSPKEARNFKILGVFQNTYVVCADDDGLILIDFHGLHERIIFDSIISRPLPLASQRLAKDFIVYLLPEEVEFLENKKEGLKLLGYNIEPFGRDAIIVRSVPILGDVNHQEVIKDLIKNLKDEKFCFEERSDEAISNSIESSLLKKFASTVACHSAMKAGDFLPPEKVRWVVEEVEKRPQMASCPHGRPLWIKIPITEIAKRFGRIP